MKKLTILITLLYSGFSGMAQSALSSTPITSGLVLDLRADIPGGNPSTYWEDQSGLDNHVYYGGATDPAFVTFTPAIGPINPNKPSFAAVFFTDNGYVETPLYNPANGLSTNDESTIFIVSTSGNMTGYPSAFVSISESATNTFNEEFGLMLHKAVHHTSSGNFSEREFPNFATACEWDNDIHYTTSNRTTFQNRPQVYCAAFGSSASDLDFYVNGIVSSQSLNVTGSPSTYSAIDRRITIGNGRNASAGLFQPSPPTHSFFQRTYVFEVLVYNRKLSGGEIDDVNNYLKCKYEIFYSRCNIPPSGCQPVGTSCFEVPYFEIMNGTSGGGSSCAFDLMIYGNAVSGKNLVGYEVSVPGNPVIIYPPSTIMPIPIVVPFGGAVVSVKFLATDPGITSGPACCAVFEMTQSGFCDGGKILMNKGGSTTGADRTVKEYKPDIMIYPNPTNNMINVHTGSNKPYTIIVTDMMGRVVAKRNVTGGSTEQISLEGNVSGVYMVQLIDESGTMVKQAKVVLNR